MRLLFIASFLLIFSPFVSGSSHSQRSHGAAVFAESGCQHCHTIRNVGGHKGPDLSGVGRRKSEAAIREQIVHGSKVMPEFGDVLKPDEISDLIAYLRSCRDKPKK